MTHDELLYGIKEIERLAEGMWGTKALRAVVELHKPWLGPQYVGGHNGPWCTHCEEVSDGSNQYPCPTIQAIEKELK